MVVPVGDLRHSGVLVVPQLLESGQPECWIMLYNRQANVRQAWACSSEACAVQTRRMLFLPADLPKIDGIAIHGEIPGLLLLSH
jgi:hypothetical protein